MAARKRGRPSCGTYRVYFNEVKPEVKTVKARTKKEAEKLVKAAGKGKRRRIRSVTTCR